MGSLSAMRDVMRAIRGSVDAYDRTHYVFHLSSVAGHAHSRLDLGRYTRLATQASNCVQMGQPAEAREALLQLHQLLVEEMWAQ